MPGSQASLSIVSRAPHSLHRTCFTTGAYRPIEYRLTIAYSYYS